LIVCHSEIGEIKQARESLAKLEAGDRRTKGIVAADRK
jgi:hypothetical protein